MTERRRPTLADRFIHRKNLPIEYMKTPVIEDMQRKTRAARKFVLDEDAAARVAEVVRDIPELLLREADFARVGIGAQDFFRAMRATVDFQNVIVEVFDSEAQTRHAQIANRLQLVLGQGAGLAFKRDFLDFIPRQHRFHAVGEMLQLINGKV